MPSRGTRLTEPEKIAVLEGTVAKRLNIPLSAAGSGL